MSSARRGPPTPRAESGSRRDVFPWTACRRRTCPPHPRRNSSCSPLKTRPRGKAAGRLRHAFQRAHHARSPAEDVRHERAPAQQRSRPVPCRPPTVGDAFARHSVSARPRASRSPPPPRGWRPLAVRGSGSIHRADPRRPENATRDGPCVARPASAARSVNRRFLQRSNRARRRPVGATPRCRNPPQRLAKALSNVWSNQHPPGRRNRQSSGTDHHGRNFNPPPL